jgi:hypothetical protein
MRCENPVLIPKALLSDQCRVTENKVFANFRLHKSLKINASTFLKTSSQSA